MLVHYLNICVCFFLSLQLSAQDMYTFERRMKVKGVALTQSLTYTDLLPVDLPHRQEVLNIELSNDAAKTFMQDGKFYVQFSKSDFDQNEEISITSTVKLYQNDLYHAKKRQQSTLAEQNMSEYLKEETHLPITSPAIKNLADSIPDGEEEIIVHHIFNTVIHQLAYDNFTSEDQGVLQALERGRGDCTEYAELMVTLCRTKKIPARIVWGVIAKNSKNARHNWVEVYFEKYGWVAFDPTQADVEHSSTGFEKMQNYYIYYSYERKNEVAGWKGKGSVKPVDISYSFIAKNLIEEKIEAIKTDYYQRKFEDAMTKIDEILESPCENYQIYNYRAKIFIEQKEYEKAIRPLQLAMKYAYFEREQKMVIYTFAAYFGRTFFH